MKRLGYLYPEITDMRRIINIYQKYVRKNTKNKRKVEKFENYLVENLSSIKKILEQKQYHCGKYTVFLITEPKLRIVMSQSIKDKIVNELVAKYILLPSLDPCLIEGNVATRLNKGSSYGIHLLKKYLLEYKGQPIYALKFDVSKYFYSIDHNIVKQKIRTKIKDPDALKILDEIIDSTNYTYLNETIDKLKQKRINKILSTTISDKEKEMLMQDVNRLPYYKYGKGLPIGNVTSQILAVFYLNDLDHFIKEQLHIRGYVRYMDDGLLLHPSKEYLKFCLKEITRKIEEDYKLKLNKKTVIFPIKNGIEFIGFRFYVINKSVILRARGDTKRRFKRKLLIIKKRLGNDKMKISEAQQILASYQGHFQYLTMPGLLLQNKLTNNSSPDIGVKINV